MANQLCLYGLRSLVDVGVVVVDLAQQARCLVNADPIGKRGYVQVVARLVAGQRQP